MTTPRRNWNQVIALSIVYVLFVTLALTAVYEIAGSPGPSASVLIGIPLGFVATQVALWTETRIRSRA